MAFREEYNSFEREPMRRLHIQREREPVYIAADRQRDREEEYLRAQNAARDRDQFAHRSSGNYDGGPSDRGFGRGVFSVGRHEVKRERKNVNRFNSNEIFRHRLISGYYQTGEGVGAVETLLPEDSDDEGPRRWSSLGEQGGGCLHQRQGKKARPSSGKLAEDPEKCLCGEDKIPKFVKFEFVLIRSGKFVQSHHVWYPYPFGDTPEKTDSWLVDEIRTAYYRELSYSAFMPTRRIAFATYIRIEPLGKRKFGELEYPFYFTTAKIGFMRNAKAKTKSIFKRHLDYPEEVNLAATERLWLAKFDKLIQAVDGDAEFFIELDEQMNFWFFFWLLILAILLSVGAGVLYGVLRKDVSTAVTLASYIVTCLALLLALIAAGDFVGLQKPTGEVNFEFDSRTGDFDEATGEGLDGLSPISQARLMTSLEKKSKGSRRSRPRN